jgi:hypothetical protein
VFLTRIWHEEAPCCRQLPKSYLLRGLPFMSQTWIEIVFANDVGEGVGVGVDVGDGLIIMDAGRLT